MLFGELVKYETNVYFLLKCNTFCKNKRVVQLSSMIEVERWKMINKNSNMFYITEHQRKALNLGGNPLVNET